MALARLIRLLAIVSLLVPSAEGQALARGKLTGAEDARDYADVLARARNARATVAWEGVPLQDAVKELKIRLSRPVVFAAGAAERKDHPVTVELREVPLASVITVIENVARVRFLFEGGVVFVTTPEDAVKRSLVMRVYDVSDLLYQPPDFPAPPMGLHPGRPAEPEPDPEPARRDAAEIVDLVRVLAGPEAWDVEGTAIALSGRLLVVTQSPEVHARIRRLVAALAAAL